MAIPAKLRAQIEAFLDERSESQGGYAPVAEGDLRALNDIILGLVGAKYETDPDGDLPVNVRLVDRTRQQAFHFHPLPWLSDDQQGDLMEVGRLISAAESNLSTAQRDMADALRHLRFGVLEPAAKGLPLACGGRMFEAHHWMVSTQALRDRARVELADWVARHPPSEGELEDFEAKQAWETSAAAGITQALGTPVCVRAGVGRGGAGYAYVELGAFVEREEDKPLKVDVPVGPKAGAGKARPGR